MAVGDCSLYGRAVCSMAFPTPTAQAEPIMGSPDGTARLERAELRGSVAGLRSGGPAGTTTPAGAGGDGSHNAGRQHQGDEDTAHTPGLSVGWGRALEAWYSIRS